MPRSKIIENTVSLTVSNACSLFFTIIQLGVLSRFLGSDLFGLFVSLRGFSLLLGTIALVGLPQVLIRFLPSYQSRGRRRAAVTLFLSSLFAVAILGGLVYHFADVWIRFIPQRIRPLSGDSETIAWLIFASIAIALKMLIYGAFSGLREMKMQMVLEFLYSAALTVFIVVERNALGVKLLFEAVCLLNLGVFLLGTPLFFVLAARLIPSSSDGGSRDAVLPALGPYWCGSILLSFVALAFTDVDRFVMSLALPVSAISLFHVASRINFILKRFLGIPILAAQPEITRIYEEGRRDVLVGRIRLFTKVSLVSSFFLIGLFAVIGRDVILLLSGEEFVGAYIVLLLLLPTVPIAAVSAPLVATMRSLHYMRWAVACDFIWMAVYFGSFFALVGNLGIFAMPVAQVIASVAQMFSAVGMAKREGFYGGIGTRIERVLLVLLLGAPLGVWITRAGGLPASIAVVMLSPVAGRYLVRRLRVLDPSERGDILMMVPVSYGRRVLGWLLPSEES